MFFILVITDVDSFMLKIWATILPFLEVLTIFFQNYYIATINIDPNFININ